MSRNKTDIGKLLPRTKIPWEKSKDQVWLDLSGRFREDRKSEVIVRRFLAGKQWIAMAASIALLLSVVSFMRFNGKSYRALPGEHLSLELPDGSMVELNASTTIYYHPFWWKISREVTLDGEAFFQVKKGSNFKVTSSTAVTEVMGTSFNVYERDMNYQVDCYTGMVRVTSKRSNDFVLLTSEMQVIIDPSGSLEVSVSKNLQEAPAWKNNMLMFVSAPLSLVFKEIERQYGIDIVTPPNMDQHYSGRFTLDASVENVLTLLCRPFDLKYERTTGKTYTITGSLEE